MRVVPAKTHIAGDGDYPELVAEAFCLATTARTAALKRLYKVLEPALQIKRDDQGIVWADLVFSCQPQDVDRARNNLSRYTGLTAREVKSPLVTLAHWSVGSGGSVEVTLDEPVNRESIGDAKVLELPMMPTSWSNLYPNSYRLVALKENGEKSPMLRFRIAERKEREVSGRTYRTLDFIDAKFLQQIIVSWLRPEMSDVPKLERTGVCHEAGGKLLSHLGLLEDASQPHVSFPSVSEPDPEVAWNKQRANILRLARRTNVFTQDKGDKITSPQWLEARWPVPVSRMSGTLVTSDAVVVYERGWLEGGETEKKRLYGAYPIFAGVNPESPLGRLGEDERFFWWRKHLDEFQPLPFFKGKRLRVNNPVILVPFEYGHDSNRTRRRLERALSEDRGTRVCWVVISERRRVRRQRHGYFGRQLVEPKGKWHAGREWHFNFATERDVEIYLRPNVIGVHFHQDQVATWALANDKGEIVETGVFEGNPLLETALSQSRSSGRRRRSAEEIKRRTYMMARAIVALAASKNTVIALEKISGVRKRSGTPRENLRNTLWNPSALADAIEDKGLEAEDAEVRPSPVVSIRVNSFQARFTCPQCFACRKKGETTGNTTTWWDGEVFHCRSCNYSGERFREEQAKLVALLGAKRLAAMKR